MATPSKRPCLEDNGDAGCSKGANFFSFVHHPEDCRGTIEEADALAAKFLQNPYHKNKRSTESCQLLAAAVKAGHFNCIESLLDAGIDVNEEYNSGCIGSPQFKFDKTPLINAITKGRLGIVKLLVARGARVNPLPLEQEDDDNLFRYPLFHALNRDNTDMVTLLMELGADPNRHPSGKQGISYVDLAFQTGRKKIFEMLLEHGAVVTKPYNYINTAIQRRDLDMFKCLVKHDAFLHRYREFPGDEPGPYSVLLKIIKAHEKAPNIFTRQNVSAFLQLLQAFGFNFWMASVEALLEQLRQTPLVDVAEEIERLRSRPQTLKATARLAIQADAGIQLAQRLRHWNLPQVLKTYLAFRDADSGAVLQNNLPGNTVMISGGQQRQVLIFHFPNRR